MALFTWTFAGFNPATWCKSGETLGFDGNLIKVATSIVLSVASSGGLERQFSNVAMKSTPILVFKRPANWRFFIGRRILNLHQEIKVLILKVSFIIFIYILVEKNEHKKQTVFRKKTCFFPEKNV